MKLLAKTILIIFLALVLTPVTQAAISSAAEVGYNIALQITNLGIVIALIVIGFGTILGRQSYNIEHNLVRLILIAIGINFSWYIATTIIGLSNAIGQSLLLGITGMDAGGFRVPNLFPIEINPGFDPISALISILSNAIFAILVIFAVIATAIMLIIRYVALTILLASMPLAVLALAFPHTPFGELWDKWKTNFLKWLIFFPAAMFFIALAFNVAQEGPGDGAGYIGEVFFSLIVIAIMIGGLMVANQLGLQGAGWAGKMSGLAIRRGAGAVLGGAKFMNKVRQNYKSINDPAMQAVRGMTGGPARIGFGTVLKGEIKTSAAQKAAATREKLKEMKETVAHLPEKALHTAEHWAEGGPTFKELRGEGWKGVKKLMGDPDHSVLEGLMGHTKLEEQTKQYQKKLEKAQKTLDNFEKVVAGNLAGLSQKDIEVSNYLIEKLGGETQARTRLTKAVETAQTNLVEARLDIGKIPQAGSGGGHGGGGTPPGAGGGHHP